MSNASVNINVKSRIVGLVLSRLSHYLWQNVSVDWLLWGCKMAPSNLYSVHWYRLPKENLVCTAASV